MDSARMIQREAEFLAEMEKLKKDREYDMVLLMITDVLREGTELVFLGDKEIIRQAFNIGHIEGSSLFLKGVVSRKKQMVPALSAKYLASRTSEVFILRHTRDLWDLFSPYFFGARNEMTYLACFDGKLKLLGVRKISEGGPTANDISVRQVATAALSFNATAVVLAHNHPSGVATPSEDDISTTLYLRRFLQGVGVTVYDHVILADDDMVSLRDSGCLIPSGF